jgi:hypothetical protein
VRVWRDCMDVDGETTAVNFVVGEDRTRPASVKMIPAGGGAEGLMTIWLTRTGARVEHYIGSKTQKMSVCSLNAHSTSTFSYLKAVRYGQWHPGLPYPSDAPPRSLHKFRVGPRVPQAGLDR